jgi:hypothetical protein
LNRYYSGPPGDHFDGVRFFNPGHATTDRDLRDLLRWKLKGTPAVWPRAVAARQVVPQARVTGMRATVVGHASVLLQAGGLNVLTDPVWSQRASPYSFGARYPAPPLQQVRHKSRVDFFGLPAMSRAAERSAGGAVT